MYSPAIFNAHGRVIYSRCVKDNRTLKALNNIQEGWRKIGRKIGTLIGSLEESIKLLKVEVKSREFSLKQALQSKESRCQKFSIELVELEKNKRELEVKLIEMQTQNEEASSSIKNSDALILELNNKVSSLQLDITTFREEKERMGKASKQQLKKIKQLEKEIYEKNEELDNFELSELDLREYIYTLRETIQKFESSEAEQKVDQGKNSVNAIQRKKKRRDRPDRKEEKRPSKNPGSSEDDHKLVQDYFAAFHDLQKCMG